MRIGLTVNKGEGAGNDVLVTCSDEVTFLPTARTVEVVWDQMLNPQGVGLARGRLGPFAKSEGPSHVLSPPRALQSQEC